MLILTAAELQIRQNEGRTQGPVTVENGYSVISAKNSVTITSDFEVKLGASLGINNN